MFDAIPKDQLTLFFTAVAAISALISAVVNVIASSIQAWRSRIASERQQLRDLAVKLAIEQWQYEAPIRDAWRDEVVAAKADKPPDERGHIPQPIYLKDTVLDMVSLLEGIT